MEKDCECYEEEVQPYRKTDYKPIIYMFVPLCRGEDFEYVDCFACVGCGQVYVSLVSEFGASSCTGGYLPSLDHLMMTTDTLIRKWHRQKLTELGEFLKRHNVKVSVIQESKLSSNSKSPSIQNFTTVRKDRRQGQGGGLLTLIHKSINFSRKPDSPETLVEPHLDELTITATLGDTSTYARQATAQKITSLPWII